MSDKWKVGNLAIHGYRIYNEQGREVVSDIYNREDAEQIVSEHNQHLSLLCVMNERLAQRLRN